MDSSGHIALGIVGAAVVLAAAFIGYREYDRARNVRELKEVIGAVGADFQAVNRRFDAQRRASAAERERRASTERRSRTLSASQRCIGGTVVEVNGSTYVQLVGASGKPVRCTGRMADSPLR